jgi:hypothetical protein
MNFHHANEKSIGSFLYRSELASILEDSPWLDMSFDEYSPC